MCSIRPLPSNGRGAANSICDLLLSELNSYQKPIEKGSDKLSRSSESEVTRLDLCRVREFRRARSTSQPDRWPETLQSSAQFGRCEEQRTRCLGFSNMSRPEFSSIQPLIVAEQVTGSTVEVTFRCPSTNVEAKVSTSIRKQNTLKAETERQIKRGVWRGLRRAVSSAIRDALGSGTAGRVVDNIARSTLNQKSQFSNRATSSEVREAVIDAFESVSNKFRWDVASNAWVGVSEPSTPFARLIAESPVEDAFDRGVLAQAIVEVLSLIHI